TVGDPLDELRQVRVAVAPEAVDHRRLVGAPCRPAVEVGLDALVPPEAALGGPAETLRGERRVPHSTAIPAASGFWALRTSRQVIGVSVRSNECGHARS